MEAKEKRERQKDPDERFKSFAKHAAKQSITGFGSGLGSFGGKPRTFKGMRSQQKKQRSVHPAWLRMDQEDHSSPDTSSR